MRAFAPPHPFRFDCISLAQVGLAPRPRSGHDQLTNLGKGHLMGAGLAAALLNAQRVMVKAWQALPVP